MPWLTIQVSDRVGIINIRFVSGQQGRAGLPDGLFSNENPNLGKLWWALD
jgi:hypothetical protein